MSDIDPDVLELAIENLAKRRLMEELRQAIIYGPPVLGELLAEYQRVVKEKNDDKS
jgi:hypothetical protein